MRQFSWMLCGLVLLGGGAGCNDASSGSQGPKGDTGTPGSKGDKGDKGDKGEPGAMGSAGAMGSMGTAGAMGLPGPKGDRGDKGDTGPSGPAGPMGATGAAGTPGATGATGATGAKGDRGDPGPQGPMGPTGSGALGEDPASFAGFTSATTSGGAANGRQGMHALCAAAFAGSHMCHASEYTLTNSPIDPPTEGAWLDPSYETGLSGVRSLNGVACQSWTVGATLNSGLYLTAAAGFDNADCSKRKPVACCNSPARTQVAGFTSMTTRGNPGGRTKMHQLCAAEFAGAHLCHLIEYVRAHDPKAIPSGGAWVDPSAGSSATSTRELGGVSGANWTIGGTLNSGLYLTAAGGTDLADCAKAKSLACCR